MGARLLTTLAALALLAGACGTDTAGPATPPTTEPVSVTARMELDEVRYEYPAYDCPDCGYVAVIRADRAVYASNGMVDEFPVDTDRFHAALADPRSLTGDPADCQRELDGNAPILTVEVVVDLCYARQGDHPLFGLIGETLTAGRALQPSPDYDLGERVADEPPTDLPVVEVWPSEIDPAECVEGQATKESPEESSRVAVQESEDRCLVWLEQVTVGLNEDERTAVRCALPRNHVAIKPELDQWSNRNGDSWSDHNVYSYSDQRRLCGDGIDYGERR